MKYKNQYFIITLSLIAGIILFFPGIYQLNANLFFGNKGEKTYKNSGIEQEVEKRGWVSSQVASVFASDGDYTDKIKITWKKFKSGSIETEKYYIYRSTSENGVYFNIGNTVYDSYDDTTALSGTIYFYKVIAYNSLSGYNKYSDIDSGNIGYPGPTWVDASDGTYINKIQITWSSVSNAERYYIFRSPDNHEQYILIANTVSTSYNDFDTLVSPYYYYKIKAYNSSTGYSLFNPRDRHRRDRGYINQHSQYSQYNIEGFLDNDTFQVVASGTWPIHLTNARKIIKRNYAKEDALLNAQAEVKDIFTQYALDATGGGPLDGATINAIQGYSSGGSIVRTIFSEDDTCEITYRINAQDLRQKVESGFQ